MAPVNMTWSVWVPFAPLKVAFDQTYEWEKGWFQCEPSSRSSWLVSLD
jgi:hypothetical protein